MAGASLAVPTGRTATRAPSTAAGRAETPRLTTGADRTAAAGHATRAPHPTAGTDRMANLRRPIAAGPAADSTGTPHPTETDRMAKLRRPTAAGPAADSTGTPRPTETDRMTNPRRPIAAGPAAAPHPTAVAACRSAQSWASRLRETIRLAAAWLATTVAPPRHRADKVLRRYASGEGGRVSPIKANCPRTAHRPRPRSPRCRGG